MRGVGVSLSVRDSAVKTVFLYARLPGRGNAGKLRPFSFYRLLLQTAGDDVPKICGFLRASPSTIEQSLGVPV